MSQDSRNRDRNDRDSRSDRGGYSRPDESRDRYDRDRGDREERSDRYDRDRRDSQRSERDNYDRSEQRSSSQRSGGSDRDRDRNNDRGREGSSAPLRQGAPQRGGFGGGQRGGYDNKAPFIAMAKRPMLEYKQESRPIQLTTNYLKVDLKKTIRNIYLLRIDFNPRIEADNRALRDKLHETCRPQLVSLIGSHYLINGMQIFSVEKPNFFKETKFQTTFQKIDYTVCLRMAKIFNIFDLENENQRKSTLPLQFFNVMAKNMLKNLNFFEFGKNTKYFEPDAEYHQKIQGTNLVVYKGWNTPFENCKEGVLMKLEQTHRLARSENALNYINLVYKNNEGLDRDERRRIVKNKLYGCSVMANYGNFKQYRILEVIFDKNLKEVKISDPVGPSEGRHHHQHNNSKEQPKDEQQIKNDNMSIYDYYLSRYGLKIKFEKQPLFLVLEKKLKKYLYFIPELCVITGTPSEINELQRKELIAATLQTPEEMFTILSSFINRLVNPGQTKEGDLSTSNIAESLGISIDSKPFVIQAKQIAYPVITFGRPTKEAPRASIDDATTVSFMPSYPIYKNADGYLSIALLHFSDFAPLELLQNWNKVQKELLIDVKRPVEYNLGEYNHLSMQEIESTFENKIAREKFDIVAIVAPNKFSSVIHYSKFKTLCTMKHQMKSQFIRQSSLEQRQAPVVAAAVLTQMAAKCGATIWAVEPPNGFPPKTMIIGTSVQKVFVNNQAQFVIGFVASLDQISSKFYSRAVFQTSNKDYIEKIRHLVVDALKQYFVQNKHVPDNIIFLRENIPDNAIQKYLATEIKDIIQSFPELSEMYKPNLCVILLETRHGVRCVVKTEGENGAAGEIQNPPAGTIIDKSITSKYHYDFYIISQNVKQGTSAPIHYKVIYDTTGFPEGRLQELLYSQCFNYVNWNGVIKFPAQIQYAKKIAKMIGTFIQQEVSERLYSSRFYI